MNTFFAQLDVLFYVTTFLAIELAYLAIPALACVVFVAHAIDIFTQE